jgi:WD40 repeat protein
VLLDVALSPDGRRALTVDSGDGGSLTVWDVGNARSVFKAGGSAEPTHARFSDDGRLVAVADVTGAVRIWDAASGKPFAGVRMQTVRHLTISHDHRFLVAGCLDGTARVWRLPEGQLVAELKHGPAFTHAVNQVAFSTDGRRHILVAGADNTARIWTEARPATPSLRHSDRVTRASFSPDGRLVLTACADGTVRVWDLAAGRLSAPPLEHDALVTRAEFDRTGRLAVTASEDRTARVWDATSGRAQGSRLVHSSPVRSAAFAVDGRVVTTSEDHTRGEGEACVWDAATGKLLFQRATAQVVPGVSPSDRGVHRAWFSPDGRTLLTLNQKGGCQVWDTVAGGPLTEILEHKSAITGASFNADASRLLTQTFLPENTIRLWESAGKPLSELFHFVQPDNTATVWEIPAGKRLASVGEPGSAVAFRHASFGWEGTQPIFLRDGAAEICDAATGQVIRAFRKPGTTITRAALSPNGQILVTISDDRTAQLWHAATGKIITTPPQFQHAGQNLPPGESWSPRFSPDGRFLVLSAPGGVRIWDAHGGDPVSPPLMHPAQVESVSFSPDGRLLLTASDRAARVWPLHAEDWGADDWLSLAELLSCARSHPDDGRLVPSRASELTPAWDRLRPKFSGAFATSPHDVTVWHAELQAKK